MNWGYKILFVYLAFVGGIVVMVIKSSSQKVDLVTTDYYAKELKYQERIDAIGRAGKLSAPVKYEIVNRQLIMSFPKEFEGKQVKASVMLYCPSDDRKDITKDLETANGTITTAIPSVNTGSHELQVNWTCEDKSYYFTDKIVL